MSDIRQLTPAVFSVMNQITTGNPPVSVGYRLVVANIHYFQRRKRFSGIFIDF